MRGKYHSWHLLLFACAGIGGHARMISQTFAAFSFPDQVSRVYGKDMTGRLREFRLQLLEAQEAQLLRSELGVLRYAMALLRDDGCESDSLLSLMFSGVLFEHTSLCLRIAKLKPRRR